MKQVIDILMADLQADGFTRRDYIVYGILAPLALTVVCILA